MMSSHTTRYPVENPSEIDEIDLRQTYEAVLRHKRLIGAVVGSALIFSTLYAFTRKPVWEGQFQIVLQSNRSNGPVGSLLPSSTGLANFISFGGAESPLETEVKILESSSILKPVFDFVKASKSKNGEYLSNWRYSDWAKDNLTIQLAQGTSVLEIAYRDTQKDLIIPVIERISKAYQAYSDRDRTRGLNKGVSYLRQQIKKLDSEANASIRAALNYGLENDLSVSDVGASSVSIGSSGGKISGGSISGASISGGKLETMRNMAQNNLNALQQTFTEAKASVGTRVFVAPQLEANAGLFSKLQTIETLLEERSSLLLPNDPSVRALKRQRQALTSLINEQSLGLLRGKIQTAQAELNSLTRPNEVILKHRELVRKAIRDVEILAQLELQLQKMQLEQARQGEPWELISNPTLLDSPVAPQKKFIIAIGLITGLVAGSCAALVLDLRTGLVFSSDELKRFIPCPLLKRLSGLAPNSWYDAADLLAHGPLNLIAAEPIALVPIGNVPSDQLQRLSSELQKALGSRELLVSNDLRETSRCATQLLVTAPGVATRTQLSEFKQKLALQGTSLAGWVLLDPDLELG